MSVFWENYQYLCEKKGCSVYDAAKACGITGTGTVSYWRRGSKPNADNAKKIAEYFDVDFAELLTVDLRAKENAARAYARATDDPLYTAIMSLPPQKRAIVSAFIAGLNADPDIVL